MNLSITPDRPTPPQREGRRLMAPVGTPPRNHRHLLSSPPITSRELNLSRTSSINTSTASQGSHPTAVIAVGALQGAGNVNASSTRPHGGSRTTPPRSTSGLSSAASSYYVSPHSHHNVTPLPVANDAIPHSSLMTSAPGHIVGSHPWEDEDDMPLARRYSHRIKMSASPPMSRNTSAHPHPGGHQHPPPTCGAREPSSSVVPSSTRSSSIQQFASTIGPTRGDDAPPSIQLLTTGESITPSHSRSTSPYDMVGLRSSPPSIIPSVTTAEGRRAVFTASSFNLSTNTVDQSGNFQKSNRPPHRELTAPTITPSPQSTRHSNSPRRGFDKALVETTSKSHPVPVTTSSGPWSILFNDEDITTNTTITTQLTITPKKAQPLTVQGVPGRRRSSSPQPVTIYDDRDAEEDEVRGKLIGSSPEPMRFRTSESLNRDYPDEMGPPSSYRGSIMGGGHSPLYKEDDGRPSTGSVGRDTSPLQPVLQIEDVRGGRRGSASMVPDPSLMFTNTSSTSQMSVYTTNSVAHSSAAAHTARLLLQGGGGVGVGGRRGSISTLPDPSVTFTDIPDVRSVGHNSPTAVGGRRGSLGAPHRSMLQGGSAADERRASLADTTQSSVLYDCDTSAISDVNTSVDNSYTIFSQASPSRNGFTRRQCADKEDEDFLKDIHRDANLSLPPADAHLPPSQRSPSRRPSYTTPPAVADGPNAGSTPMHTAETVADGRSPTTYSQRNTITASGPASRKNLHPNKEGSEIEYVDYVHSPEGRRHIDGLTHHEALKESRDWRTAVGADGQADSGNQHQPTLQGVGRGVGVPRWSSTGLKDSTAYFSGVVEGVALSPQQSPHSAHDSSAPPPASSSSNGSCTPMYYGPPVVSAATKAMYEAFVGPETNKDYPADLMLWRMMSRKAEEERLMAAKMLERLAQRRADRDREEAAELAATSAAAAEAARVREEERLRVVLTGIPSPVRSRTSLDSSSVIKSSNRVDEEENQGENRSRTGSDISILPAKFVPTHTLVSTRERAGFWGRPSRDAAGRRLSTGHASPIPGADRASSASTSGHNHQHQGNGYKEGEATPTPAPSATTPGGASSTMNSRRLHYHEGTNTTTTSSPGTLSDVLDSRFGPPLPPDQSAELFDRVCQSPSRFVIKYGDVSPRLKQMADTVDVELGASWSRRGRVRAVEEGYVAKSAAMRSILLEGILTNCEASETAARYLIEREWRVLTASVATDHNQRYLQDKLHQLIQQWQTERAALEREADRRFHSIQTIFGVESHRASLLGDLQAMVAGCQLGEQKYRKIIATEEQEQWTALLNKHRGGQRRVLVEGVVERERVTRSGIMREGYLAHMAIFDRESTARQDTSIVAWRNALSRRTMHLLNQLQEAEEEARRYIEEGSARAGLDIRQTYSKQRDALESRERSRRDHQRQEDERRRRLQAIFKEEQLTVEHDESSMRNRIGSDEHTARLVILQHFDDRFSFAALEARERIARAKITKELGPSFEVLQELLRRGRGEAASRQKRREEAEVQAKIQREMETKARRSRPFIGFALAEKVMDGRRAGESSAPAAVASGAQPHLVVDALFVGGPAYRQGLRLNDTIVSIAGDPALSLAQVRLTIAKRAVVGDFIDVVIRAPIRDLQPPSSSHNESTTSKNGRLDQSSETFGFETQSYGSDDDGTTTGTTTTADESPYVKPLTASLLAAGPPASPGRVQSVSERTVRIPVMTADVAFSTLSEWFFDISKHHQITREMDNTVVLRSVRSFVSKQQQPPSVSPDSAQNDSASPPNRQGSATRDHLLVRSGSQTRPTSDDDEADLHQSRATDETSPPFHRPTSPPTLPIGKPPLAAILSPLSSAATPRGPVKRGSSSGRLGSKGSSPKGSFRRA